VSDHERILASLESIWPNSSRPMFFLINTGNEEMAGSGTSFLNRSEAASVEKLVTSMLRNGLQPDQIGVITPYEGQRSFVVNNMQKTGALRSDLYKEIEVASVDSFQGREKDIIIVSCVRSNAQQGIGFLRDPRRLNVALTRARYGIIIIGNARLLARNPLWYTLLTHFQERNCIMEGPINHLQISMISLPKPKITSNDKRLTFTALGSHSHYGGSGVPPNGGGGGMGMGMGGHSGLDSGSMMMMSGVFDPTGTGGIGGTGSATAAAMLGGGGGGGGGVPANLLFPGASSLSYYSKQWNPTDSFDLRSQTSSMAQTERTSGTQVGGNYSSNNSNNHMGHAVSTTSLKKMDSRKNYEDVGGAERASSLK
jgi:hypothetical protein